MLKKLSYLAVVVYLFILYGQNLLEFGSDLRIDFYFVGMALSNTLFAFILFKAFKNAATSFYLFMCIGSVFNQSLFEGSISYMDVSFGCIGVIYILLESKIKKLWKK